MLEKLKRADIPQELVLGWPRSVLLGDEKLIVEQHQGIFACTETEVALKTLCGLLVISGEKLSLSKNEFLILRIRAGRVWQDQKAVLPPERMTAP